MIYMLVKMKKCPVCNSSRIQRFTDIINGKNYLRQICKNCGFENRKRFDPKTMKIIEDKEVEVRNYGKM